MTGLTLSNRVLPFDSRGAASFKFNNAENALEWTAQFIDGNSTKELNKIYKKIVEFGGQQGSTGITVLPVSVVNSESLLLQSVIDCNFKLH